MAVKLEFFQAGYCEHPENIVLNNHNRKLRVFPALWALITHPQKGFCLFDTGYSSYFALETGKFPYSIYAKITPVRFSKEDGVLFQLNRMGIDQAEIKTIILSHFHADHIAGCKDFPGAQFICSAEAYAFLRAKRGLSALRHGFVPGLLPADFATRISPLEAYPQINIAAQYSPFQTGYDLCGDRSVIAVWLEGHACGHFGLLVATTYQSYFLISDGAWASQSYQQLVYPHKVANLLFNHPGQYRETLQKLHQFHQLHPEVRIVPSHCGPTLQDLMRER